MKAANMPAARIPRITVGMFWARNSGIAFIAIPSGLKASTRAGLLWMYASAAMPHVAGSMKRAEKVIAEPMYIFFATFGLLEASARRVAVSQSAHAAKATKVCQTTCHGPKPPSPANGLKPPAPIVVWTVLTMSPQPMCVTA